MRTVRLTDEQLREVMEVYGGIAEEIGIDHEVRLIAYGIHIACLRAACDVAFPSRASRIARPVSRRRWNPARFQSKKPCLCSECDGVGYIDTERGGSSVQCSRCLGTGKV